MGKVRRAIQRIDIPAVIAALVVQSLLFAENVMRGKLLADALADQGLGGAVGCGHQVGVPFVFDLQPLVKIFEQKRAGLARNGGHSGKEAVGTGVSAGHGC